VPHAGWCRAPTAARVAQQGRGGGTLLSLKAQWGSGCGRRPRGALAAPVPCRRRGSGGEERGDVRGEQGQVAHPLAQGVAGAA